MMMGFVQLGVVNMVIQGVFEGFLSCSCMHTFFLKKSVHEKNVFPVGELIFNKKILVMLFLDIHNCIVMVGVK